MYKTTTTLKKDHEFRLTFLEPLICLISPSSARTRAILLFRLTAIFELTCVLKLTLTFSIMIHHQ